MTIEKVDLLIIGAGPAGLAAAAEAAARRARVIVLDESPIPGGRLPAQIHREPANRSEVKKGWFNGRAKASQLTAEAKKAGARILCGTSVWGIFPGWFVGVAPTIPDSGSKKLPIGFRSRAVVIATGAAQNPMILPGWTLPGVITAGAAQMMINVHGILPGRQVVLIGLDPLNLSVAQILAKTGIEVRGILLPFDNGLQAGPCSPSSAIENLTQFSNYASTRCLAVLGQIGGKMSRLSARFFPTSGFVMEDIRLCLRQAVLAIDGNGRASEVTVAGLKANGAIKAGTEERWPVDSVITAAGLYPLVELLQGGGCPLVHVPDLGGWVPVHDSTLQTPVKGLFVAGSVSGVEGAPIAESQGRLAGLAAADYLNLADKIQVDREVAVFQEGVAAARKNTPAFFPNIDKGRDYLHNYSLNFSDFV
jgi:sarcosine oxidase subunit alpha